MGSVSLFLLIPFLVLGGIFLIGIIILGAIARAMRGEREAPEDVSLQRDETGVFFMNGASGVTDATPFDTGNAIDAVTTETAYGESVSTPIETECAPVQAEITSSDAFSADTSCACDTSSSCGCGSD